MNNRKITRFYAAVMSVLMLQTVPMDFTLPVSANDNTGSTECAGLDMIPTGLRETLEQELQNAIEIDKRTESDLFSIGTINNDGTRSLMTFSDRIKYYDTDTANIRFIDNTIIPAVDEDDIAYVNQGNSYRVCFPNRIENGLSFTNEQYSFNMKPSVEEEGLSPKIVNKNEVVYNDVFDASTDIHYALENSGIKESIIVNEYTGRNSYEFIFSADGLIPDNTSGSSITFLDEISGDPVYVIQPINIVDSYDGDYTAQESHITYDNYYEIEELSNTTYLLRMNLDANFLDAESTVYPCIIDPSVWAVTYSAANSSYVVQSTGGSYVENQLSAGHFNGSGEHLSYIKATSIEKLRWIEPNRLLSAYFNVKDLSSSYLSDCTINCYDSTINANVSSVSYSGLISSIGAYQSAATFTTIGASYSFNITTLFRQWIKYKLGEGGKNPEYGFILRGATNASTPGRYFSSTSSSNTYFYLVYQEGEEIQNGFYNIRNESTGTYLRYNSGGQLYLSSTPSSDNCKWQIILDKSLDGTTTYGVYTLRPFNDLNVSVKGVSTNESVTTNSSGNKFRIIRNADGTFRIMPAGSNYTQVSNAIGLSSGYATIQEYSNVSSKKWTFEPVVNRYFSEYTPDRFNINQVKHRMNCYGYAFGYMLRHDLTSGTYYKQIPGEFETEAAINANLFQNLLGTSDEDLLDKLLNNMSLDADRFGYTLEEYTPSGTTIEQFGANSRLIAVAAGMSHQYPYLITNFHFYMQHNDGTWSHKQGQYNVTNYYDIDGIGRVYLTNDNIQIYAGDTTVPNHVDNGYVEGRVKYYIITKDAVADYPHGPKNQSGSLPPTIETETYFKDQAGDCMFTASSISTGTKSAAFDADNDIDFYVFNSSAGSYTLTTSCQNGNNIDCDIYDYNGNVIQTDHSGGQVNITFSIVSNKNYFIEIYNKSGNAIDYTLTLS